MPSDKVEETIQINGSQGPLGASWGACGSARGTSVESLEAGWKPSWSGLGARGGGLGAPGGALGIAWGTLGALLGPLEPERLIKQKR